VAEYNITPSFKVIKSILLYKEYHNKDEVMQVAATMAYTAKTHPKFKDDPKTGEIYQEAHDRLSNLTFEQMIALKEILTPVDPSEIE